VGEGFRYAIQSVPHQKKGREEIEKYGPIENERMPQQRGVILRNTESEGGISTFIFTPMERKPYRRNATFLRGGVPIFYQVKEKLNIGDIQ